MNILTHPVHTGYQYLLSKTGHQFYSLDMPGSGEVFWDHESRPLPDNYHRLRNLDDAPVSFELTLVHYPLAYESLQHVNLPLIYKEHCIPEPFQVPLDMVQRISCYSFASDIAASRWQLPEMEHWRKKIIGLGIETELFHQSAFANGTILSVGQSIASRGEEKGKSNLLALAREFQITVVGKGNEGIPGAVGPAKDYTQLREFYGAHQVYLNPSNIFGFTVLEAMAAGMAIVTFPTINSGIIQNGFNGLVVNNVAAASEAISRLLKNPLEGKRLGENARQTSIGRYSMKSFCARWNELFQKTAEDIRFADRQEGGFINSDSQEHPAAAEIVGRKFRYNRVGFDGRLMTFLKSGWIGEGRGGCEVFWSLKGSGAETTLEIHSGLDLTCGLKRDTDGIWKGCWSVHERMPIELIPI